MKVLRKAGLLLVAALLCATMAFGYTTGTVTLDQLIGTTNQNGLLVGDKVFYDFQFSVPQVICGPGCSWAPTQASQVTVSGAGSGSPIDPYAIELTGAFFAASSGSTVAYVDFLIKYTVETINGLPLINGIGQSYVGGVSGSGGIIINEQVYQTGYGLGDPIAQSQLDLTDKTDPPGESIQGDNLIISPPLNKVYVIKDILLVANAACPQDNPNCGQTNLTSISYIRQSVHQVPEPGFYGLMALGLSGLVLAFRRKRTD